MTDHPCLVEELRTLFLFERLDTEQLELLCHAGRVEELPAGQVFTEGEPAADLYVMLDGEVVLSRRVGADDVEITRSSRRGAYAGATGAYLRDRVAQVYSNSMRALRPSRFFVLPAETFARIMAEWFPMAQHLLEGLFTGTRNTQDAVAQRERLLALGSLSAGLMHELNNPAAAAVRAGERLRDRVAGMRHKLGMIAGGAPFSRQVLQRLVELQEQAVERVAKAPALSAIDAADAEDDVADWLTDAGIAEGWELAATLVQAGLDREWLDRVADAAGPGSVEGAVRWLAYTVETEMLITELTEAAGRISELVAAAKQYSQPDRGPHRPVDVRELLDSTVVMLGGKLGPDVTVVRDYQADLPRIPARGSELNQVWTNLVDNAAAAMPDGGTLTLSARADDGWVTVTVADTGAGIPEELLPRIFEPFFTTKPVGEGTGLGLDICWRIVVVRHHGDLRVRSRPGCTEFEVRLPLRQGPDADDTAD